MLLIYLGSPNYWICNIFSKYVSLLFYRDRKELWTCMNCRVQWWILSSSYSCYFCWQYLMVLNLCCGKWTQFFFLNNKVVMESKSLFLLPKHLFILYWALNFFEFVQLYWIVNCFFTIVWRFYSIETVKMDFLCA